MAKIVLVGLGPHNTDYLSSEALKYLKSRHPLFFRTLQHPAARHLAPGKKVRSFDRLYRRAKSYDQGNRAAVNSLIGAAKKYGTICYMVPGNPLTDGAFTGRLLKTCAGKQVKVQVLPASPGLDPLLKAFNLDAREGILIRDPMSVEQLKIPGKENLVFFQVCNRATAYRLKRRLMKLYPSDHPVTVLEVIGSKTKRRRELPLKELGCQDIFASRTAVHLPPYRGHTIGDLIEVMEKLRAADGCPWDKKQTHQSLRQYLVEEAYEVIAAIDQKDDDLLREELGDVLLQVVFHSQIAGEENRFSFFEVVHDITEKLIRRHPHVFGRGYAADPSEVKVLWEKIKSDERNFKKRAGVNSSRDEAEDDKNENIKNRYSVDQALPALLKAYKLQKKAAEAGFDWPCVQGALEKAREELLELEEAFVSKDQDSIEEELGDYLFTVVNISRFIKVNPELALGKTVVKFMDRFHYVLEQVEKTGQPITSFSLETLDKWWEEAKKLRKMRK